MLWPAPGPASQPPPASPLGRLCPTPLTRRAAASVLAASPQCVSVLAHTPVPPGSAPSVSVWAWGRHSFIGCLFGTCRSPRLCCVTNRPELKVQSGRRRLPDSAHGPESGGLGQAGPAWAVAGGRHMAEAPEPGAGSALLSHSPCQVPSARCLHVGRCGFPRDVAASGGVEMRACSSSELEATTLTVLVGHSGPPHV